MKMVQRIENLNHYTKSIVHQPNFTTKEAKDDLIYVVSNISIYAIRQER